MDKLPGTIKGQKNLETVNMASANVTLIALPAHDDPANLNKFLCYVRLNLCPRIKQMY